MIILGKPELMLKDRAQFGTLFIIPNRIAQRQRLRVNLVNRNVDMHVIRVVVDDAYPLMFSVADSLQKRSSITRSVWASGFSPALSETSR